MKRYHNLIFFILFLIFEEIIFNVFTFESITTAIIYKILFSIFYGGVIFVITNLSNRRINHILSYIFMVIITIIYMAQFIYYNIYKSVISVYSIVHGGQVFQFLKQIIMVISNNIHVFILLLLPLIAYIILDITKNLSFHKVGRKNKIIILLTAFLINIASITSFYFINNNTLYSRYNLYFKLHAPLLTAKEFGIMKFMNIDLYRSIINFKEKDVTINIDLPGDDSGNNTEEEEVKYKDNKLDIDFNTLINNEKSNEIKSMHEYFKNEDASSKNQYTGIFEGKNVIVFVAEAFSSLAIDENLTPTLYKLANSSFKFNNFYTPLFPVSTADGEYMTDTSLIPKEGVWSLTKLTGHYMPYSYANVFENLGYTSQAYHNNTATYYKRNSYIDAMGYDSFKACGKGLNINCRIWPQSDLEMIEATVDDYINDDKFLAYYMTVSGHLEYTRLGNMMVTKNWDYVKDLDLSDKAKSYLACNIEFDRAVAKLIEKLEEADKLKDTVIVISGDHYPYGLSLDEVNELSTYKRDENFEVHNMPLIIWNSEMETVEVDKIGSSLDVLPTVLNLFGVEYDSRLFMGRDLLSDSDGLVIFSNRSFITEKGRYNALTGTFESSTGEEVSEDYINYMKQVVYNKFKYSRLILDNDYYRIVFGK